MTNDIYIKKYRNVCNNGTVYNLIWNSRIDDKLHSEMILSKDSNPISEEHVKHMLVMMAVHNEPNLFLASVSESLPVQEENK